MLKKLFQGFVLFLVLLIPFRGQVYRCLVTYEAIGQRPNIAITNQKLIDAIERKSQNKPSNAEQLMSVAMDITCDHLQFTFAQAPSDPNTLVETHQANCVGYSAMFQSVVQYIIRKYQLEQQWQTQHLIGKLYVCGVDIHPYFDTPFFRDHDFNLIKNLETGQTLYADPSTGDYLWIPRVEGRSNH